MPSCRGGFEQTDNAQAGVDVETQAIVEHHVSQQPNDLQKIEPALENSAREINCGAQLGVAWKAVIDPEAAGELRFGEFIKPEIRRN